MKRKNIEVDTVQLMKRDGNLIIAIPKNFTQKDTLMFLEHLDGYLNTVLYNDEYGILFSELTETAGELTFRIIIPNLFEDYEMDILVFRWNVLCFELKDYYCLEQIADETEKEKEVIELREKIIPALEEFFSEKI